ncbi:MAG TPA: DoxX family protein [Acidimicrobiales bacterium]|nr:DoxX family protein [Acidimicrobiales bacterium]
MRNAALLGTRLVLGGYLAVHGAQKLFGSFGGPGLDRVAQGFEHLGLTPGRQMAILAGATELGGGILTAAGIADPLGPVAIIGAMSVASTTHRANGALAAKGGYELPLTNLAAAASLAAAGPGRFRLGPSLPAPLVRVVVVVGAALGALSLSKLLSAKPQPGSPAAEPQAPAAEAEEAVPRTA